MVDFGGWEMPQQYGSIRDEHFAVRKVAGLFDVSHMGRLVVDGSGSEAYLQRLLTNDCLLYTSPSPRDLSTSRMPSSA